MATVNVFSDDGTFFGSVQIDGKHGPWSDDWQYEKRDILADLINQAVRSEGGE